MFLPPPELFRFPGWVTGIGVKTRAVTGRYNIAPSSEAWPRLLQCS
ncbi:hypothetical protein [Halomonas caseinilytica]|uniref:Uncharacterized protein n=1 Tax=Halomonas caseinilytica TaxID=438744 RepID=A0A1M6QXS3_9GAMM|nr:hypothetical protein [Halomonas caseinilytica]SHK25031.1 hypothetical protein SAMN05192556_102163 [Halomonas caseinilytica]